MHLPPGRRHRRHPAQLREAGIVLGEPRGRYTYYRLDPDVLEAAAGQLSGLAARARANVTARREC